MTQFDRERAALRRDVREALDHLHPDGVIANRQSAWMEQFLGETYVELEKALSSVVGGELVWEFEAFPGAVWEDDADEDGEDEDEWDEETDGPQTTSYHRFFVAADGDEMRYETEAIAEPGDIGEGDWPIGIDGFARVPGQGMIGCLVGVSLLAPFATVTYGTFEEYEHDDNSVPDVFPSAFDPETAEVVAADADVFGLLEDQGAQRRLRDLRQQVVEILRRHGVEVLGEGELSAPTPWLSVDEGYDSEEGLTVRDALFVVEVE